MLQLPVPYKATKPTFFDTLTGDDVHVAGLRKEHAAYSHIFLIWSCKKQHSLILPPKGRA